MHMGTKMKKILKVMGLTLAVFIVFYGVTVNVIATYTRHKTAEYLALKDEHEQIFKQDMANKRFAKIFDKKENDDSFTISIDRYKGFINGGKS